jgi:class 3 adenylate cyclase
VERKLAAVLFVDLVDSTELVAMLDPEVVRRRVSRYFERVSHRIEEHGGRSKSSPATRSWPHSASRGRTRTTPSVRCAHGPFDVVFHPGFISHVELMTEMASYQRRIVERLAAIARVIVFDQRGVGICAELVLR